jgi:hypothetical protein
MTTYIHMKGSNVTVSHLWKAHIYVIHVCACVCACACVCLYVCVCMCMYVCMYVCWMDIVHNYRSDDIVSNFACIVFLERVATCGGSAV